MSLFHINNYEDAPSKQHISYDKLHKLQPLFEATAENFKCVHETSSWETVDCLWLFSRLSLKSNNICLKNQ
jgi:hypothetical protein